jgi:hypothetical protein
MRHLLALLVTVVSANAATYYIDYNSGNDWNNGTSKSTPWKRHPYMAGWSGSYSHTAGDRYIFKGGVTWPRPCFQMRIRAGGLSNTVRDYYGVSKDWYAGAAWSLPVFDFQDTVIGTGWNSSAGVWFESVHNITFDSIELKRHRAPITPSGATWGAATINLSGSASYITIQNCVIRDWSIPTPGSGQDGSGAGGVCQVNGAGKSVVVTGCTLHQANTSVKSGCALRIFGEISYCEIYKTPNAVLGGGHIHHNHIHDIVGATDPLAHENAIYTFTPSTINNNHVHHLDSGSSAIYVSPSFTGGTGYDHIYENVVYAVGYQAPVQIDMEGQYPSQTGSYVHNNNLQNPSGICIRVGVRGSATLGLLDAQNNTLVSGHSSPICYNNVNGGCGNVITAVVKNNTVSTSSTTTTAPTTTTPTTTTPTTTTTSTSVSLSNGSFESGYTSWVASGNQRVCSGTSTDGSYAVQFNYGQLAPNGILTRNLSTIAGKQYTLTFDLGAFSIVNRNEQRLQVTAQGGTTTLASAVKSIFAPGNGTKWAPQSFVFTANSSTTTLTLRDVSPSTDAVDLYLDNVRLSVN